MNNKSLRPAAAAWLLGLGLAGCAGSASTTTAPTDAVSAATAEAVNAAQPAATAAAPAEQPFQVVSEQFADLRILRYQVPGFEELTPQQKELL